MTPQMSRTLDAIKKLTNGDVAPSFQEIGDYIGVRSKGNVHRLVNCLKDRGYVTYEPERPRSIRIVNPAAPDGVKLVDMATADLHALKRQIEMVLAARRIPLRST